MARKVLTVHFVLDEEDVEGVKQEVRDFYDSAQTGMDGCWFDAVRDLAADEEQRYPSFEDR